MGIFSDSGRIGQATFSDLGGAVNDLFSFEASGYKAKSAELEAASYREAATLAVKNEEFEKESAAGEKANLSRHGADNRRRIGCRVRYEWQRLGHIAVRSSARRADKASPSAAGPYKRSRLRGAT